MNFVYILFSKTLNKYYIGEAIHVESRLIEHNSGFYKKAFTSASKDWSLFLTIECQDRVQARKIETHLKNMKSIKYYQDLKNYPEIIDKLKLKYK